MSGRAHPVTVSRLLHVQRARALVRRVRTRPERCGACADKKHKFEARAKIVRGYKSALRDAGFEAPPPKARVPARAGAHVRVRVRGLACCHCAPGQA